MTKPEYNCEYCEDSQEFLADSYDHNGEHVQYTFPCECTKELE